MEVTKIPMSKAIGTKLIQYTPMTRKQYNDYRGWELPADENGDDEGYLVEYLDSPNSNHPNHKGYISWSPEKVFNEAYRPASGMNFGLAVEALKKGKKVARRGWNGKGMWLVFMPPFTVDEPNERTRAHGITEAFECGGYIVMWTAQGIWQPGWLASQADILADDWMIVD